MIFSHKFVIPVYLQLLLERFFCTINNRIRKLNFGFDLETRFVSLLEVTVTVVLESNKMEFIYKY